MASVVNHRWPAYVARNGRELVRELALFEEAISTAIDQKERAHFEKAAACCREELARLKLKRAGDPTKAELYLSEFQEYGNPVFAWQAIQVWPGDQPLAPELMDYLRQAARMVHRVAETLAEGRKDAPSATEALGELAFAFGFSGPGGRASGAFAEYRDYIRALVAAGRYRDAKDDPSAKAETIIHHLAQQFGLSPSQMKRLIKRGQDHLGPQPRKRDLRMAK